jgi:hypothetical protein
MITEVEALNEMLGAVSQRGVTSSTSLHPVALEASLILAQVNKTFQAEGWDFNRSQLTLSYQPSTGKVILPTSFLEVDPVDVGSNLTHRSGALFDPINNTDNIGEDVKVFLTVLLDVEDMPHVAASYMVAMASEQFYSNRKGDQLGMRNREKVVSERQAIFQRSHARKKDFNSFNGPQQAKLMSGFRNRVRSGRNGRTDPHNLGG